MVKLTKKLIALRAREALETAHWRIGCTKKKRELAERRRKWRKNND